MVYEVKEDTILNEFNKNDLNIFMNKDDMYVNFDLFENGKSHILFIDGLYGSGKSTLAKELSNLYDCNYTKLDVIAFAITGERAKEKNRCRYEYIKEHDIMLFKYVKEKNIPPDFMADIPSISEDNPRNSKKYEDEKIKRIEQYIHWLVFEQDEKCIIEGVYSGIILYKYFDKYKDIPIIIKGTSLLNSMKRRLIRDDKSNEIDSINELMKYYLKRFKVFHTQYKQMFDEINLTREKIINYKNNRIENRKELKIDINNIKKKDEKYIYNRINQFNSLENFCNVFTTIEEAISWYEYNNIRWSEMNANKNMSWPDDILKNKEGNCLDHAIFFYYFCKLNNIESRIYRYAIFGLPYGNYLSTTRKWNCFDYIITMVKSQNGYYFCNYNMDKTMNHLFGPFKNINELENAYDIEYEENIRKLIIEKYESLSYFKKITNSMHKYFVGSDIKIFDDNYNTNILQSDLLSNLKYCKFKYDEDDNIKINLIDNIFGDMKYKIKSKFNHLFINKRRY